MRRYNLEKISKGKTAGLGKSFSVRKACNSLILQEQEMHQRLQGEWAGTECGVGVRGEIGSAASSWPCKHGGIQSGCSGLELRSPERRVLVPAHPVTSRKTGQVALPLPIPNRTLRIVIAFVTNQDPGSLSARHRAEYFLSTFHVSFEKAALLLSLFYRGKDWRSERLSNALCHSVLSDFLQLRSSTLEDTDGSVNSVPGIQWYFRHAQG